MDGKLVGINTAIFSKSGGSHGIGFAIPSNMVRLVVQAALKGGKVQRPWLGASLQPVTPDIADSLGLDRPSGALVKEVHAKGPAARAGIAAGDVIVSVDGKEVQDPHAFQYRFATKGLGGSVDLSVIRKGQTLKATVALIAPRRRPAARYARALPAAIRLPAPRSPICRPPSPRSSGSTRKARASSCSKWRSKTPAQRLGVQRGDIIVGINNSKVGSVAELVTALDGLARRLAALARARRQAVQSRHSGLGPWPRCSRRRVLIGTPRGRWRTSCAPPRWPRSSARIICSGPRACSPAWSRRSASAR